MTERCSWLSCDRTATATVRRFGGKRWRTCTRCAGSVSLAIAAGTTIKLEWDDPGPEDVYVTYDGEEAA